MPDSQEERDQAMVGKGYLYRIEFDGGEPEPLYVKGITEIGPLMREYYPTKRFKAVKLFHLIPS